MDNKSVFIPEITTSVPSPAILTHPNIPKPLHGLSPRNVLGKDWWDEKRHEAYRKFDNKCYACGINKSEAKYHNWLEAHESYKIDYDSGVMEMIEIVALCHSCHNFIHSGRLYKLLGYEKVTISKYRYIMKRGFSILKKSGLKPFWGTAYNYLIHLGYSKKLALFTMESRGVEIPDIDNNVEWSDWRLRIGDNKYEPIFDTFDDWKSNYNYKRK